MVRTIIWFAYFWYRLFITYPALLKAKKLHKGGKIKEMEQLIFKTAQDWARSLVKLTGSTIEIKGRENLPVTGPFVIVSNHQGNFDIPILLGFLERPIGFISKVEVKKLPIIRDWMVYMNCVFLDRQDRRQAIKAINQGAENIKKGTSIVIFPEGTRSKKLEMNTFKSGSFKLAQKAEATIVPIAINGSFKIMEQSGNRIKPAKVTVTILPVIKPEDYKEKDLKIVSAEVQQIIFEELQK
ncbi:lysophospholipid acyltransferase family protein [Anaerobacillus isosaccharinicus]|uniref:1-acyl-sn-glycerol-3-phosphate acyltransferase n=1 Tax=Anaerobacillus isosaccharinicus TaxID=1532552 RepID=A0A1S2LAY9_9BACI|nr:lysophospholipid acyltransferase family protein [Anaerobacillus isosaccharinicus]MBA5588658.1 1-acyl-sn-glycerol-3-phosphate acyltransferase [Anaerobacillus isosaccharinicus]QOY37935.1 1-acyl-sn-glycerol-3-phosphate acyltransferase [Anaerobacillus isosaccharinicus]